MSKKMTERERILTVFDGKIPDQVPYMLDLSYYYFHKFDKGWEITGTYVEPEYDLIDYHKRFDVGFFAANQSKFFAVELNNDVQCIVNKTEINGNPEVHWKYITPIGEIERVRVWEQKNYAWGIKKWGVETEQDLKVLGYALAASNYAPIISNYTSWDEYVGDIGIVYLMTGYSAMGHILNYWMGIEKTIYACVDWEDTMREVVDQINDNILGLVRILAEYPAAAAIMGDNFSSLVQPPSFFNKWSAGFYREACDIFHKNGKKVACHTDGHLRGAISMLRDVGVDIIDGITTPPMGDLTPNEARDEAGPALILSGGMSTNYWLPDVPVELFKKSVLEWMELRKRSSALIAASGCQVPLGAEECRLELYRELVDKYGRY